VRSAKASSFQDNKQIGGQSGSDSEAQQPALDGSLGGLEIRLGIGVAGRGRVKLPLDPRDTIAASPAPGLEVAIEN